MRNTLAKLIFIMLILFFVGAVNARETFFKVQSIDTMKFSRDVARSKLGDPKYDTEIEAQISAISKTGATHVAIATPYDDEFLPFLKRWVKISRNYNLHVWFRGNWSGWEKWFDYPKIDRQTHLDKTKNFILSHPDLFEDGDVFTACPECENGGPGDPRQTGDTNGFRKFLIDEYQVTRESFQKINKHVISNYDSMNADVARLVMNEETIQALDNVVAIDHYVKSPDQYTNDLAHFFPSGTQIVLGEFGAPIPDLHGDMSEADQARWVDLTLKNIVKVPHVISVNYWTNKGSSTELWDDSNSPKQAAGILTGYFIPINVFGSVTDTRGRTLDGVEIDGKSRKTVSKEGKYVLPVLENESVYFHKKGYVSVSADINSKNMRDIRKDIVLSPEQTSGLRNLIDRIIYFITHLFTR